jgi:hypothetical protein
MNEHGEPMVFDDLERAHQNAAERARLRPANSQAAAELKKIFGFDQIPNIQTMEIPPIDYLVPGMISRKTITLWTGADGTGKTFLLQSLSIAVATGGLFLGRRCQQAAVLYLDYENPSFAVRDRFDLMATEPIENLKVWGTWLEQQPPQIGSDLLLQIARHTKPLIIIDPFRYAHGAEENDSTEMMAIMQSCRYYAAAGGCVILLHHPAKTENSHGRGSSAIRGAADVAYLQEMSDESGLITLKCVKNRFGERFTATIRPDYDLGAFALTDSPEFTKRTSDTQRMLDAIIQHPGLSQNAWHKATGMMKARFVTLVKENNGSLWREEKFGNALRYFPICSQDLEQCENNRTGRANSGGRAESSREQVETAASSSIERTAGQERGNCSTVLSLYRENREQVPSDPGNCSRTDARTDEGFPACGKCGSHALYREASGAVVCMTCNPN